MGSYAWGKHSNLPACPPTSLGERLRQHWLCYQLQFQKAFFQTGRRAGLRHKQKKYGLKEGREPEHG